MTWKAVSLKSITILLSQANCDESSLTGGGEKNENCTFTWQLLHPLKLQKHTQGDPDMVQTDMVQTDKCISAGY